MRQSKKEFKMGVGALGKSVSELYPIGQVEIDGRRYDARSNLGQDIERVLL